MNPGPDQAQVKVLRQQAEEHLRSLSQQLADLERPLYRVILEYVMLNHTRPELCTLREMERALAVPYSRLKKLVDALIAEGILVEHRLGTIRPVSVGDLEQAFSRGYLQPTYDQLVAWVKNAYRPAIKPAPSTPTSPARPGADLVSRESMAVLLSDFPKWYFPALWSADWAVMSCDLSLALARTYLPTTPAEEREQALADYRRIRDDLAGRKPADEVEPFFGEVESKARHIAGQLSGLEDLLGALGSEAHHTIPFIYTVAAPRFGGGEGLLWPMGLWSREVWFELDGPGEFTPQEASRAATAVAAKQLAYLTRLAAGTLEFIEEHGVEGTLRRFNQPRDLYTSFSGGWTHLEPRYSTGHLLYQLVALAYGIAVAIGMGVDDALVAEGRRLAQRLRAAVDGGYRGRAEEGRNLKEYASC